MNFFLKKKIEEKSKNIATFLYVVQVGRPKIRMLIFFFIFFKAKLAKLT
jgi:hypothetical protein